MDEHIYVNSRWINEWTDKYLNMHMDGKIEWMGVWKD